MAYIESYKDQPWLLPPSIEDLIPDDHICFLVEGLVDSLDYTLFDIKYSGAGHPAHHPRILVKLLIMGVIDRVRSSRRLARNARENIVYLYLSEKLSPDFRTISDFRKDNPGLIKEVFKQTVSFGKQENLIDLTHLSTDGSKIKANAANKRTLTKEELGILLKFVDEELEAWGREDEREDQEFGDLRGSDQLPRKSKKVIRKAAQHYIKEIREKGLTYKEELQNKLHEAKQEAAEQGLKKVSITDSESRFMKNKKGPFIGHSSIPGVSEEKYPTLLGTPFLDTSILRQRWEFLPVPAFVFNILFGVLNLFLTVQNIARNTFKEFLDFSGWFQSYKCTRTAFH